MAYERAQQGTDSISAGQAQPVNADYQRETGILKQVVRKSDIIERRRRYLLRWTSIKAERSKQWDTWQDLADFILPERGRFIATNVNQPKDISKILNNTPTTMARALAAGLMSGVTSPARPWFNLTFPDPTAAKWGPGRLFLYNYNMRMRQVLDLSGFYKAMAMGVYPDLATFGLGTCLAEESIRKVIRFVPLAVGSYGLAQDGDADIDTLMYDEPWTVGELVKRFGWKNVSGSVRTAWNSGFLEQYVLVLRIIAPNDEYIPGWIGPKGMRWGSAYMEIGGLNQASGALAQPSSDPAIGFLEESGYHEFPVLAARWSTTARDVYPTGPGHDALNDARGLMQLEKRSLLATSKGVNPAMLFPDSMRSNRLSALPGDAIYVPAGMQQEIKPAFVPDIRWGEFAEKKIAQAQDRVGKAFFAPLLAAFTNRDPDDGVQPKTAAEIAAIHGEVLLQLGPVLENLNEFLSHLIDRTAAIMERRGLIPPAPKELRGMSLKVEFISVLAQAQKLVGTAAKERFLQFAGQVAQLKGAEGPQGPAEISDKVNSDKMLDRYADDVGVPPDVLNDDSVVAQKRAARAKAAQAQQQGQAMLAATEGAKNLGQADAGEDSGSLLSKLAGPIAGAEAGGGA